MNTACTSARGRIWGAAAAIASITEPTAPARYDRLQPPSSGAVFTFEDIALAPVWLVWPRASIDRLAVLTGAVGVSRCWRFTIDGGTLRRAMAALGSKMLDRVLDLPDEDCPDLGPAPAERGDESELLKLGASLLQTEYAALPGLGMAISTLFPDAAAPYPDAAQARVAGATALALMAVSSR